MRGGYVFLGKDSRGGHLVEGEGEFDFIIKIDT